MCKLNLDLTGELEGLATMTTFGDDRNTDAHKRRVPVCILDKNDKGFPVLKTQETVDYQNEQEYVDRQKDSVISHYRGLVFNIPNSSEERAYLVATDAQGSPIMLSELGALLTETDENLIREICLKCLLAGARGYFFASNRGYRKMTDKEEVALWRIRSATKTLRLAFWDSYLLYECSDRSFYYNKVFWGEPVRCTKTML